jgi:hypothetical protein
VKRKLGSAALMVAILVLFFIVGLILAALFRLLLTGLTGLLALLMLSLLMLSRLTALLTLFFRIVRHELLLFKRGLNRVREFVESSNLVAAMDCKGWERIFALNRLVCRVG